MIICLNLLGFGGGWFNGYNSFAYLKNNAVYVIWTTKAKIDYYLVTYILIPKVKSLFEVGFFY